jgi:polysaccharide export outer membrane protein
MKAYLLPIMIVLSVAAAQEPSHVNIPGAPAGYVLGPGDQFSMEIADLEELNGKIHRIDNDGTVSLPLVGRIQAAGLTLAEFEKTLDAKLVTQLKDPHITITVTETLSQPVSVMGSVNAPGIHQIRGQQSLAEVLSLAGGLRPDAGYRVVVTRQERFGELPVPNAKHDPVNRTITGDVNVPDLLEARNPAANIRILPHDLITVPRAKVFYVMGEVKKSGGFTLEQKDSVSIIQALALAEGTTPTAAKQRAMILRQVAGAPKRSEIQVDLDKILKGKTPDVQLVPDDILYVPNSVAKSIRGRAIETAVSTASGVLIWRGL